MNGTVYTITGTDANGCKNTTTHTIVVNTLPTITASSDPVCDGEDVVITASGATSYTWSPMTDVSLSGTGNSIATIDNAVNGTVYTITGTDANGCSNTATATVTVNTLPTVTVNNPTICAGETATLTAGGAVDYTWSPSTGLTITDATHGSTATTTTAGTWTVTGTDANGCSNTATATITVNPLPTLTVTPTTQSICPGGAITTIDITATNATTTIDNVTLTPNGGVATASDLATLGLTASPALNPTSISGNVLVASGDVISFTVTATSGYTPSCGVLTENVTITIGDTNIVTYNIDTCDHYTWRHDGNPTYNASGVYRFGAFKDHNNCDSVTYLNLTIRTNPTPSVDDKTICLGNTATLTVNGDYDEYLWNTSATTQSIEQTPTAVNTYDYNVTVTQYYSTSAHCQGTATAHIIVQDTVNLAVTNDDQTVCLGEEITPIVITYGNATINDLSSAVEAIGLTLTPGTGTATISGKPTPANASAYTFTVTATSQYDSPACDTKEKTISILVNDTVVPVFSTPEDVCTSSSLANDSIEISVQPLAGYTYTWDIDGGSYATSSPHGVNGTSDTNRIVVRWANEGDKTVSVTIKNNTTNCEGTAKKTIHVHKTPVVEIAAVASDICPYSGTYNPITATISTTTTADYTYTWSGGVTLTTATTTTDATTNSVTATIPTTSCDTSYKVGVNVVDNYGCKANADSITLTVKDVEVPTFTRPADIIVYKSASCTYDISVAATGDVSNQADNCTPVANLTVSHSDDTVAGSCYGETIVHRAWRVTDQCGNISNAADSIQTITIQDKIAPTISGTLRDSTVVGCDGDSRPAVVNTLQYLREHGLTISDNCSDDAHLTVSSSDAAVSGTCDKTIIRTYRVTDDCGNYGEATQNIYITFPTFPTPADGGRTVPCEVDAVPPTPETITLCGNNYTATPYPNATDYIVSSVVNGEGTVTYNYQYTDCHGSYDWKYVYAVHADAFDSIAPKDTTVVCPVNVISKAEMESTKRPTITVCNETVPYVFDSTSTTINQSCGDSVYHYHYVVNGRTYIWTYTTHVVPTDFTMPDDSVKTVSCPALVKRPDTVAGMMPVVTDKCGFTLTPEFVSADAVPECIGSVNYTYKYTDCAGHEHPWHFRYTINRSGDPVVATGFEYAKTVECLSAATELAPANVPHATSSCGEDIAGVLLRSDTVWNDPSTKCEGTVTFVYKYVDCAGDSTGWTYTYTIDRQGEVTINSTGVTNDSTVVCASMAKTGFSIPTATSSCNEPITGVLTDSSFTPDPIVCNGTKTYTYTYTDCSGSNSKTWVFTYHITLPDSIAAVPATDGREVPCAVDAIKPGAATIQDVCGRDIVPVYVDSTAVMNIDGTGTVTHRYRYTDCTNSTDSIWKYIYTINPTAFSPFADFDTTVWCKVDVKPETSVVRPNVVVCGVPQDVELDSVKGYFNQSCGDSVYYYHYVVNGTKYNWKYTSHVTPLDFVMPADSVKTVSCPALVKRPDTVAGLMPVIKDSCGFTLTPVFVSEDPVPACEGDVVYTYKYTDCQGHEHLWHFNYTIDRTGDPVVATGFEYAKTVECLSAATVLAPANVPHATSSCGEDIAGVLLRSDTVWNDPSTKCEGTVTFVYKYVDCAGDSTGWTYTYTIDRQGEVTINSTGVTNDSTVVCASMAKTGFSIPTATSSCNEPITGVLTDSSFTPDPIVCNGTKTYTYTYTDCSGSNSKTWVFTYHITLPDSIAAVPATDGREVPCAVDAIKPGAATIQDVCGRDIVPVYVDSTAVMNIDGTGTVTHRYRYTDCTNSTDSIWKYIYTINPTAFSPFDDVDTTVWCKVDVKPETSVVRPNVVVCGVPQDVELDSVKGYFNQSCGDSVYYYHYVVNGTKYNWKYTSHVTPLDFVMPADSVKTVSCPALVKRPDTVAGLMPVIKDSCGFTLTPVFVSEDPVPACEGDVVYTYKYTDCQGHEHLWHFNYTIDRTGDPVVATGFEYAKTVECLSAATVLAPANVPHATSSCGEDIAGVLLRSDTVWNDPSTKCEGTVTFVYKYVDCAGDSTGWTYTYTIDRQGEVTINSTGVTNDSTVVCASMAKTGFSIPTATSSCNEPITGVLTDSSFTPDPIVCNGTKTYTYTYTDCSGSNSKTWVFTYHITLPDSIAAVPATDGREVPCAVDAIKPGAATIQDVCGRDIVPVYVDSTAVMNIDGTGTVTHRYRYTDCTNSTDSIWKYIYTINPTAFSPFADFDTTVWCKVDVKPETSVVRPNVVVCGVPQAVELDSIKGYFNQSCGDSVYYYHYIVNGTKYNWKYTSHVTPLDFDMPADSVKTVSCPALVVKPDTVVGLMPVIKDSCGFTLTPVFVSEDPLPACEGSVVYTYKYTDCQGHEHLWHFRYTIDRTGDPVVATGFEYAKTVECLALATELAPANVPHATSSCGEDIAGVLLRSDTNWNDPTTKCEGTVTFVYKYVDCAGDSTGWTYTYTILRQGAVTINSTGIADKDTVICPSMAMTTFTVPTATSSCGETITGVLSDSTYTEDAGSCNATKTYTYTYTDCSGNNSDSWTFTYRIELPETIAEVPADGNGSVACAMDAFNPGAATIHDVCGRDIVPVLVTDSVAVIAPDGTGTVTYQYKYTDCAGHDSIWTFVYNVNPNAFSLPDNDTIAITCPAQAVEAMYSKPVVSECGIAITPTFSDSVAVNAGGCGVIVHRWTYNVNTVDYVWRAVFNVTPADFEDLMPTNAEGTVNCAVNALAAGETGSLISLPVVSNHCDTVLNAPVLKAGYPTAAPDCNGDIEFVYTYSDCAGHNHDWMYTYHIDQPDFAVSPATGSSTVECAADALGAGETGCTWTLPVVTSACGETLIPVDTVVGSMPACEGDVAYTYTYRDCAGHEHTFVYTYTIERHGAVTINSTGIADKDTVICPNLAMTTFTVPTATSSCGETITGVLSDSTYTEDAGSCNATKTYTYTYTDCSGNNSDTWTFEYRIELPVVIAEVPADGNGSVACAMDAFNPGAATIHDACGREIAPVLVTDSVAVIAPDGTGTVTYQYKYTDCAGHDSIWTFVYNVNPNAFSLPDNDTIAITCPAQAVEAMYSKPVVSECGIAITPTFSDSVAVNAGGCGVIVHRWTYNVNTVDYVWRAVFNVTPADFEDLMPANAEGTVNCAVNALAAGETGSLISLPVVSNHCDTVLNAPVLKAGYPTAAPDCNGDIEFVYTYTDCAGHNHDWMYTYHIDQPDFAVSPATGSSTVECTADALGAGETGCTWTLPVVTSACGETLTPVDTTVGAMPACEGNVDYTYTYRDCAGHEHTFVYTYTIERHGAVTINSTGIADKDTVICPNLAMTTFTVPTATSSCGETITGVLSDSTYTEDAGSCNATKTYTYTYTDCSGNNSDSWTFTYRIELPVVIAEVPADGGSGISCAVAAVVPGAVTIHDVCGREIVPVYVDSTAAMNPNGTGTVTHRYRYTDCAGHDSIWTYVYTVTPDAFNPVENVTVNINCVSEVKQPTLDGANGSPVIPVINVCGDTYRPHLDSTSNHVGVGGCGDTIFYYGYTVNAAQYVWSYTYHVEPLPYTMPADDGIEVECLSAVTLPTAPVVTNPCDTVIPSTLDHIDTTWTTENCEGQIAYVFRYMDCMGRENFWTYTYTIDRVTTPSERGTAVPIASTVACIGDAVEPAVMPEVRDVCDNILSPVDTLINENTDNCNGFRSYTYTYRDCAGLEFVWTYTYMVRDTIAPVMNAIADQAAIPADGCQYKIPDLSTLALAASSDNCGNTVTFVSQSPVADSRYDQLRTAQTINVTVTVSDECGNETQSLVMVNIPANDIAVTTSGDAAICLGESTTLTANGSSSNLDGSMTYSWSPATGLDRTDGTTVVATPTDTTVYTVIGTDANGCQASASATVVIYPLVVLNASNLNQTLCAGADITPIEISYSNASLSVNGLPNIVQFQYVGTTAGRIFGHPDESGNFSITATSLYGCPQVVLQGSISVNDTIMTQLTATACDQYTWATNGATYGMSGRYRWATITDQGCDSVVYLTLTVNYQSFGIDDVTECDSYTWTRGNGQTYTTNTQTPTFVFPNGNAVGCDSTVTLHLTIHYSNSGDTSVLACDSYSWYGQTYTEDIEVQQHLLNQWGCDSLATLHLRVRPSYHFSDLDSLCEGDTYRYHNNYYTTGGDYDVNFLSEFGCDSVYSLHLVFLPMLVPQIDSSVDCINGWYELSVSSNGDHYQWSSKPGYGGLEGQENDTVIHVTPNNETTFFVTASYGDNLWCPQTAAITVDRFVAPRAEFELRPPHVTDDKTQWYADYHVYGDRNLVQRQWYVDGELYSQQSQHISGQYDLHSGNDSVVVELIATSAQCADTAHKAIPYIKECIYIPNVFTPGRESNNLFGPVGSGIVEMEMWIYNREGLIVFHSTSQDEMWDGTHQGTGVDCPTATYAYRIDYKVKTIPEGYQTKVGTVTIIR